ncbi:MAG: sigma-70 family RNA polymerase sigma factor [Planctomycetota bacterium]|jgi:RNA polymerase sigma-70 factor (ECF subfamily)
MDDSQIEQAIEELRAGDDSGFADLYSFYRPRLERSLRMRMDARLRGRIDVDDLLQDCYLAASKRLQHFRSSVDVSLLVWLRSIGMQTLVDAGRHHLQAKKRDPAAEQPLDANRKDRGDTASELPGELIGQLTSPSAVAMRAERAQQLEASLAKLPDIDREILILRHIEELSNNETAEVLGIHKAASTNRYRRALRRLKESLEALPEFDPSQRT